MGPLPPRRTVRETAAGGTEPDTGSRRGRRQWAVVAGAGLAVAAVSAQAMTGATFAAFSATTSVDNNTFTSGTVTIGDNDNGGAMFAMANLKPGSTDSGCILVTYTGSLPATVRLYGTTTGTGLDSYLDLKVTRGTKAGGSSFDSCDDFSPDAGTYVAGQSGGVVYSGTVQGFPDSYAAGLVDATTASPESWTTGEAHAYRFDVTMRDDNSAQGLSANQKFIWEAQNS